LDCDVLIAGAGPAGCATAVSLAQFAPDLRVVLADAAPAQEARIGETVPPPIKPILEHLGLWGAFAADGHAPSYRTLSAWGSAALGSNEFILHPSQVGWRLDRVRFNDMMRHAALARVAAYVPAPITAVRADAERWHVACGTSGSHCARLLVDATGRPAVLARLTGQRPVSEDRLVGCFVHFAANGGGPEEVLLEAFADGWWYTAAIPEDRRVVACMSDADLVGRLGLAELDDWMDALAGTRHLAPLVRHARPLGPPRLRAAASQIMPTPATGSFIAVGDAASCFDPISGQGILKALRSGIFASYAIADSLCRDDPTGMRRYCRFVQDEFAGYRATLRAYYALERRWSDHPFWRRRKDEGERSSAPSPPPTDTAMAGITR
jgi:2-polyprenyl-6-methoxyphenol hydroxylase-like FAD-dependent oxidoreductase